MNKIDKLLMAFIFLFGASMAAAQINMGAMGDSITDEYLKPNPAGNRYNTDLAAHSWLEIVAQTRPTYINFGTYAPPGGTPWPQPPGQSCPRRH